MSCSFFRLLHGSVQERLCYGLHLFFGESRCVRFVTITTTTVCPGRVISCDTGKFSIACQAQGPEFPQLHNLPQPLTTDLCICVLYLGRQPLRKFWCSAGNLTFNNTPHFFPRYITGFILIRSLAVQSGGFRGTLCTAPKISTLLLIFNT